MNKKILFPFSVRVKLLAELRKFIIPPSLVYYSRFNDRIAGYSRAISAKVRLKESNLRPDLRELFDPPSSFFFAHSLYIALFVTEDQYNARFSDFDKEQLPPRRSGSRF